MKHLVPAVALLASGAVLLAQERDVPKDSARITVPGCADDRTFIIASRPDHEPASAELLPGRRFRLSGPKAVLEGIKQRERMMIEVTGLVRKADLAGPGGVTTGGGRVRIGAGPPREPLGSGPSGRLMAGTTDAVLDVEGWMSLLESCPSR